MPIITTYPFKKAPLNSKDEITISDVNSLNAGFDTKSTSLEILAGYIIEENSTIVNQSIPLKVWGDAATPEATRYVSHGLNKFPSVTVVNSANEVVIGNVRYITTDQVQLTFSAAFSGKAYFN
tara:strand:- start:1790 stop:2158 length:369 start_codon:yes stop_codon:yes gene_type:complete